MQQCEMDLPRSGQGPITGLSEHGNEFRFHNTRLIFGIPDPLLPSQEKKTFLCNKLQAYKYFTRTSN